jgi:hypothetical protein
MMQGSKNGNIVMSISGPGGRLTLKPALMTQKDIDDINKFIDGLKTYSYYDENIYSIIQDEAKAFFFEYIICLKPGDLIESSPLAFKLFLDHTC